MRPLDPADLVRGQYAATARFRVFVPTRRRDVRRPAALHRLAPLVGRAVPDPCGQRLPVTATEAIVEFADLPLNVFPQLPLPAGPTLLRFRFHPDAEVALSLRMLTPAGPRRRRSRSRTRPARARRRNTVRAPSGSLHRRQVDLFVRQDTVEACWRIVARVLTEHSPAVAYAPGTWGPAPRPSPGPGDGSTRLGRRASAPRDDAPAVLLRALDCARGAGLSRRVRADHRVLRSSRRRKSESSARRPERGRAHRGTRPGSCAGRLRQRDRTSARRPGGAAQRVVRVPRGR